jgi:putative Mg2+ transporter-C (MgtC) family protein
MEFDPHLKEMVLKLIVSLIIGTIIGAEREYRNKSAGLRTIILICLGSTIFTIVSFESSHESEVGRIASNIVTGIGFLGAGAIIRDGLSISGLTTASAIWVAAALGMAVGVGQFQLSLVATAMVMVVLVAFNYLQRTFDRLHKVIVLHVIFDIRQNGIEEVENRMNELRIRYERIKERRQEGDVKYEYQLTGDSRSLDKLVNFLIDQKEKVKSFEY